jgi:hypothetical protein
MLSPFGGAVFTMRITDDAEGRNEVLWSEQWKRKEREELAGKISPT